MIVSGVNFSLVTLPRPFRFTFLTMSETLKPFTQFSRKIRAIKWQKMLKFCLLGNYFSNLFTGVQRHLSLT